ncbi:unnamed protein product [Microthlaspi erraticum]|uniref:GAG-pre-integrase domain-containing protein n=1 Tax=Microthlaspi erraticum TaxID=1685480 RepID=A0A6D2J3P2_9BRAS|nr:unnamed protein product [Microthlaspi erraticum]
MQGESLTMRDKEGKILVKATRSKNRLYKVRMGIIDNTRLNLTETSGSSRWHSRLGHINLDALKLMMQKKLVFGIPSMTIEKKLCGPCLLGKQADKHSRKQRHSEQARTWNLSMETCVDQ